MEQLCVPLYEVACAAAGLFELRVRMTVDRFDSTRVLDHKDLSAAVSGMLKEFGNHLHDHEIALLNTCLLLRNKLFHVELSRATGKLRSLGEELVDAGVWKIDLASGEAGKVRNTSTATGRIVGWLMESAGSGAFTRTAEILGEGGAVLRQLLERVDAATPRGDHPAILPALEKALWTMHRRDGDEEG